MDIVVPKYAARFRDAGLAVPANLSVIGFDDMPLAGSLLCGETGQAKMSRACFTICRHGVLTRDKLAIFHLDHFLGEL